MLPPRFWELLPPRLWELSSLSLYESSFPDVLDCYDSLPLCDTINQEYVCGDVCIEERPDMSIAVGLIGTDGIVLATDSRLTQKENGADYHLDNSTKLWQLTDKVGIMSVGANCGYRHYLVEQFQQEQRANIDKGITYWSKVFSKYIQKDYSPYLVSLDLTARSRPNWVIQFILAGYDLDTPRIFSISSSHQETPYKPQQHPNPYYFAEVSDVAIYWARKIDLANRKPNVDFLKRFAVMIIMETCLHYSDRCGGEIQMAVIKKDSYQEIAVMDKDGYHDKDGEVARIKANLDSKQQWLYDYLKG